MLQGHLRGVWKAAGYLARNAVGKADPDTGEGFENDEDFDTGRYFEMNEAGFLEYGMFVLTSQRWDQDPLLCRGVRGIFLRCWCRLCSWL